MSSIVYSLSLSSDASSLLFDLERLLLFFLSRLRFLLLDLRRGISKQALPRVLHQSAI
jgi:hypothetical protein